MKYIIILISTLSCICQELISNSEYSVLSNIFRKETYYTQGLIYHNGILYESGGLYGESVLVKKEYPSLKPISKTQLDKKYFAEGIGVCKNKLYQLTWNERSILSYIFPDLAYSQTYTMDKAMQSGWGLASFSENQMIATDGSSNIYFLDCNNDLKVVKTIEVKMNSLSIDRLNAITYAKGYIYANRYYDSSIYKIDANNGNVIKVYNMNDIIAKEKQIGGLTQMKLNQGYVLNGITYIIERDVFILTGKKWNNYYEVILK